MEQNLHWYRHYSPYDTRVISNEVSRNINFPNQSLEFFRGDFLLNRCPTTIHHQRSSVLTHSVSEKFRF